MVSVVAAWPTVALGEVLSQHTTYIDTPESRQYQKLSVKLYGRGVVLDAPADGALLKMQRHQLAHVGQVILSEIWGKKGAIGIVPPDGEGALCTSHFFLFDINHDRLDPRWMQAIFTANYLQEQLDGEARGTTGYAAVRPKHLLAATIPLPPLDEQRRIVARIEALAARIAEAQGLRQAAMVEAEALLNGHRRRLFAGLDTEGSVVRMNLDTLCDLRIGATPSRSDPALWGGHHPWVSIADLNDATVNQTRESITDEGVAASSVKLVSTGTLLMSFKLTIGKFGIAGMPLYTNEAIVALPIKEPSVMSTPFLVEALRAIDLRADSKDAIKGATLNKATLSSLCIPVPQPRDQEQLVTSIHAVQAEVDALRLTQTDVAAQLDALLPSLLDKAFRGEM